MYDRIRAEILILTAHEDVEHLDKSRSRTKTHWKLKADLYLYLCVTFTRTGWLMHQRLVSTGTVKVDSHSVMEVGGPRVHVLNAQQVNVLISEAS